MNRGTYKKGKEIRDKLRASVSAASYEEVDQGGYKWFFACWVPALKELLCVEYQSLRRKSSQSR